MAMCENDSVRQLLAGVQTQAAIGSRRSKSLYTTLMHIPFCFFIIHGPSPPHVSFWVSRQSGNMETAHSTWVIHCCYFYTVRLVNQWPSICRDTPIQPESTGHSHSICPSLESVVILVSSSLADGFYPK